MENLTCGVSGRRGRRAFPNLGGRPTQAAPAGRGPRLHLPGSYRYALGPLDLISRPDFQKEWNLKLAENTKPHFADLQGVTRHEVLS